MWSRRELLAALGTSSASVVLGGWLGACAVSQRSNRKHLANTGPDDLLPQLLEIVDGKLSGAFVWSRGKKRYRVSRDTQEKNFDLLESQDVVVGGDGYSLGFSGANRDEIIEGARSFVATLPREARPGLKPPPPFTLPRQERIVASIKIDPSGQPHEAFHRPVAELFEQSLSVGNSRIIYRNAYSLTDEEDIRFLSRATNQHRREFRQRKGILFAAWTGDQVISGVAEHFGSAGLELPGPAASELERSVQGVLAQVHARSAPSGAQSVILGPECASLVAMEAIAKPAFRNGIRPVQSPLLQVSNDPTRSQGYGSYLRDARGDIPEAQPLFGVGAPQSMEKGNLRRDGKLRMRACPANVIIANGTLSEDALVAEVIQGVYLDDPIHCSVDPAGNALALLCGRGREIRNGRFTGRLFSRLLCSASCASFFSETRALGKDARALAFEEEGLTMSAQAPSWLSRAQLEAAT